MIDYQGGLPANWVRLTASQIIEDHAVVLYGVQAYVSGQSAAQLVVHDGLNANAPTVLTINVKATTSKNFVIGRGILLTHGLYVTLGANITECTVASLPYVEPVRPSGGRREVTERP